MTPGLQSRVTRLLGAVMAEVCRKYLVSPALAYCWRAVARQNTMEAPPKSAPSVRLRIPETPCESVNLTDSGPLKRCLCPTPSPPRRTSSERSATLMGHLKCLRRCGTPDSVKD